jgi:uncharacterized membrane protein YkvA (DUF1232 family)
MLPEQNPGMDGISPWLVAAGVAIALYAAFVLALVAAGQRRQARALAAFLPHCAVLLKRLVRDPRVPRSRKVMLALLAGYLAMPIDLVPDFIPVAGQLDDAILVALALRSLVRKAGTGLLREHWPGPLRSLRALLRLAGVRET